MVLYQIALAVVLGVVYYFSGVLVARLKSWHDYFTSFSGGAFATVLLVSLFPTALAVATPAFWPLVLLGFVVVHTLERHALSHHDFKKKRLELSEVYFLGFFTVGFFSGVSLALGFAENTKFGLSLFVALVLQKVSSSLVTMRLLESARKRVFKIALSASTFIGLAIALIVQPDKFLLSNLLAFTLGMLLYLGVRDAIPHQEKGRVEYFLSGALITLVLLELF